MSIFTGENAIYDFVSNGIKAVYPTVFPISTTPNGSPAQFPCVSIDEVDSYADPTMQTADSIENHTIITYQIDVFSNKQTGSKQEAKQLADLADKLMCDKVEGFGFRRTSRIRTPNLGDKAVYRITMRYWGKIDENGIVYSQ